MARKKKDGTKTSQVIHLEGDNYKAVYIYHNMLSFNKEWNYSRTINKIIEQWREKIPPLQRGYEQP